MNFNGGEVRRNRGPLTRCSPVTPPRETCRLKPNVHVPRVKWANETHVYEFETVPNKVSMVTLFAPSPALKPRVIEVPRDWILPLNEAP